MVLSGLNLKGLRLVLVQSAAQLYMLLYPGTPQADAFDHLIFRTGPYLVSLLLMA